jgi:YidC/Oxa1 family membrane protein insertase
MQQSQRIIMYVLPFAFIFVIARFPAGLVLYWMTTNLWTVGQGLITRRLIPKVAPPATGQKRSSRTPKEVEAPASAVAPEPKQSSEPRRVKRKKKARR